METVASNELGGPYFNSIDIRIHFSQRFAKDEKKESSFELQKQVYKDTYL